MTTREILEATKARIDKPQKWCRHRFTAPGRECAYAALVNASRELNGGGEPQFRAERALVGHGRGLEGFNDTHTHAEVMALFDRAIASAS